MKSDKLTQFFASRLGIIVAGATIGLLGPLLQFFGNPKNMGVCVACFERDIAGALGLHRAAAVQYIRPEIIGFVLGSFVAAILFREFKARNGSAPILRFVLGAFAMIGALVFLGCPWRANFRLAGGDLNAIPGIIGLVIGIAIGVQFLKTGYSLGRNYKSKKMIGLMFPILAVGLLLLAIFKPLFTEGGPIFASIAGPGSQHAPLILSLIIGLFIGFIAQRTRFCTMGAVRDIILIRDTHLVSGLLALIVVAFFTNLFLGQFNLGFVSQPIAHSNILWNILGMVLAGLAYVLAGGCPGRQLFLAGEGDADSAIFIIGMISGGAFAHNFGLVAKPDSVTNGALTTGGVGFPGMIAVAVGLIVCLTIGFVMRENYSGESK